MKWCHAQLRVMLRLFELGLFDEVNTCYRKYCIEGTKSDFESFKSLVLEDNDIKLYCDEFKPQNISKKKRDYSDIVAYYYKATACFTMVKAIPKISESKLNKIKAYEDMPVRSYNVLFEQNGDIKDDVLIKAFKKQDFPCSPKVFVSTLLSFNQNLHPFGLDLVLPSWTEFGVLNKNKILTSQAAQDTISSTKPLGFSEIESSKKIQAETDKEAPTSKEVNYFNIDSKLDSGLQVLKIIDLLGMHLLLVAQRRQYMFERYSCDDLRSHYKALEKVNSDDVVRLHNNALDACLAFEENFKGLHINASYFNDCNMLVKDYVGRIDALYQYIGYFVQLFYALEPHYHCTNKRNSWEVEYYYFNLYDPFKHLSALQSKILIVVNSFLSADVNLIKCLTDYYSYEQEIVNGMLGSIPQSVFDICANFAPSFDDVNLSNPSVVDFKAIVNSVMSYYQSLNHAFPTLPYPINKGSKYDVEDCGEIIWLKRRYRDSHNKIYAVNEKLAYEVINDPKPIVFSRKLNVYFDMFCVISELVELYNNYYLRCIYIANGIKPGSKLSFAFDLSYCGEDLVKTLYPAYELLLKDETFIKLIECHQACFEHLVLILDLQGDINLLYEDNYMSNLLRKTNNYDQEIADSLTRNIPARDGSDSSNLSKAEQLLLNKTCISYLQDCQKIVQLNKEFVEKTTELDKFLNEKLENFVFSKNKLFSQFQNICLNPIIAFSQYIISNLDNVPEDLKLNLAGASSNVRLNNEDSIELNQSFYKCMYETLLAFFAKNMNQYIRVAVPYSKLATKEDFAKSLSSVGIPFNYKFEFSNSNYLVLVAYKRLLQNYNYDQFISKHICYNTLFINGALIWIINIYSYSLNCTILPIAKYFVRLVLSFTRINQVKEYQHYLNIIYNLLQKLTKLFSTKLAKIKNLIELVGQGNVVLCECFEYKSYLGEIVDVFSLYEGLWRKFKSTYTEINSIYDACQISDFRSLYKDLLEDAPRVLQCIDVNFFKNMGTKSHTAMPYFNAQNYVSINRDYVTMAISSGEERLSIPQLSVVEHFFGQEISAMIKAEDDRYYGVKNVSVYLWSRHRPREKGITKTNIRFINLVSENMRIMDDEELHQLLNLDNQKISTQIVDSSAPAAASKPKAKAVTTKGKAVKAADNAEVADTAKVTQTKSTKKATRAKKTSKAEETSSATNCAKVVSPKVDEVKADAKAKAKATIKATATKSRAKKLATTSANEATATVDSAEVIEAEPQKKATRAKKASTTTATAKATAGKDASAQSKAEVELEVDAKPKSTRSKAQKAEEGSEEKTKAKSTTKAIATKSRAKKVATVDSTEAKAEDAAEVTDAAKVAEAAPKKKASTARTTSKASASTRAKKSTTK